MGERESRYIKGRLTDTDNLMAHSVDDNRAIHVNEFRKLPLVTQTILGLGVTLLPFHFIVDTDTCLMLKLLCYFKWNFMKKSLFRESLNPMR